MFGQLDHLASLIREEMDKFQGTIARITAEGDDLWHDFDQNLPSRPQSLQDYLTEQLSYLGYAPDVERLMRHIISNVLGTGWVGRLDENYHFHPLPLEELAASYDLPVTAEQVENALKFVQKFDPPGVGARNLVECLLLQVSSETPHAEVVRVLIENHLDDITHNRLPLIQKKTGYGFHTISDAIEALRHLHSRPGTQYTSIPYDEPDIIVVDRTESGDYSVRADVEAAALPSKTQTSNAITSNDIIELSPESLYSLLEQLLNSSDHGEAAKPPLVKWTKELLGAKPIKAAPGFGVSAAASGERTDSVNTEDP